MHIFLRTLASIQQALKSSKKQIWIPKGYGIRGPGNWISGDMIRPKKYKRAKCLFWSYSASFDSQTLQGFCIRMKNYNLQKSTNCPNMSFVNICEFQPCFFGARRPKIAWQLCRRLPLVRPCWNLDTSHWCQSIDIPSHWVEGDQELCFLLGFYPLYIWEDKLNRHWPNLFRWMHQTQGK